MFCQQMQMYSYITVNCRRARNQANCFEWSGEKKWADQICVQGEDSTTTKLTCFGVILMEVLHHQVGMLFPFLSLWLFECRYILIAVFPPASFYVSIFISVGGTLYSSK